MPPLGPKSARFDSTTFVLLTLPPLFWAGNSVVGRMAVGTIAPMTLNAVRWLLAIALVFPFAARGLVAHRATLIREWRTIAVLGICGVGSYNALQYLALTTSTPNNVTLIAASAPAFTLLLGAAFFGSRVGSRRALGAAVSLAGVLLVLVHGDLARLGTLHFVAGDLFMLAASLIWSVYTWILRTRRPDLPLAVLLFSQILAGLAFALPLAIVESMFFATSHFDVPRAWLVLAYVAVLPSIVGYVCWDRGVARAGATLPMFFTNLTPLFAALLSGLLLADWPHWYHGVALVAIAWGIWLARE